MDDELRRKILEERLEGLMHLVENLVIRLERINMAAYVELLQNPRRLIFVNLLAGVSRGLGIALGATVVAAVFLYILGRIAQLNLPLIGDFIARVAKIVQTQL